MLNWSGTVAIVTGAAAGIGRALALELVRRGARVVVADIADGAQTVELARGMGGEAVAVTCDVTDQDAVMRLVEQTRGRFGKLNAIFANAGGSFGGGTVTTVKPEEFRRVFELNVFAVLSVIQASLPALKESGARGEPAVAMITGSEHSLSVPPISFALIGYTSSKHALLGLARCLRRDLQDTGVKVALLCPGWVRTERLMQAAKSAPGIETAMAKYGQDVGEVARLALAGIDAGALVIPTSPSSRAHCIADLEEALEAVRALPTPADDLGDRPR